MLSIVLIDKILKIYSKMLQMENNNPLKIAKFQPELKMSNFEPD